MIVELKAPWFAPSPIMKKDEIQSISGRRFKKGVQEVPDNLKDYLPKDAKILKDIPEEKIESPSDDLKDYDQERIDADTLEEKAQEGELAAKRARMAKARASKGARKGAATVE